ncbi:MAG: DNA starvation/stationary phase protection protein [Planctomycetota bacterium]
MSDTPIIDSLNGLVADAIVLYYKIHNYHWNLRGPSFFTLHEKFEEMYDEYHDQLDVLAERVLQLGGRPVGNLSQALQLTALSEETGTPRTEQMVQTTLDDVHQARERLLAASKVAQEHEDKTTENILDDFIDRTAKNVWMLGAYLDKTVRED